MKVTSILSPKFHSFTILSLKMIRLRKWGPRLSTMQSIRDILNILAQCNRYKLTPTCTSSLRFSLLYILMLWFIVHRLLYYIFT